MNDHRIHSVDTIKGVAISVMIMLHVAMYHYGRLDEVDITDPPPLIMVLGVLALWGGLFGVISGLVNSYRYALRSRGEERWIGHSLQLRTFLTGFAILIFHLIYSAIAAPPAIDLTNHNHSYGLIANLVRFGSPTIDPARFAHGTALQMLGVNLMGLALLLPLIARRRSPQTFCLILGALFLATGVIRIVIAPVYGELVDSERYLLATLLSPFAAEPYPVLPYFAFALTGAAMGFALSRDPKLPSRYWIIGAVLFLLGITGVMLFPTNLQDPGPFWYAKVFLELGIFTLIIWLVNAVARLGKDRRHILQKTARMSLTAYVLSTPLAELLSAAMTAVAPDWNDTIPMTLLFAAANSLLWFGIVALWAKARFTGSLEHLWIRLSPGSKKLAGWREPTSE